MQTRVHNTFSNLIHKSCNKNSENWQFWQKQTYTIIEQTSQLNFNRFCAYSVGFIALHIYIFLYGTQDQSYGAETDIKP